METGGQEQEAMRLQMSANDDLALEDGARVAVVGGGPAGSFFSYFLQQMAGRVRLGLTVHIYEPRDFAEPGPKGCNMCGGIVSESLVQHLAAEGINIPASVIHRRINSYVMHLDIGLVHIANPVRLQRIAAVHRGGGPRGLTNPRSKSFDGFLLDLAKSCGAHHVPQRVDRIGFRDGRPWVHTQSGSCESYDLLVGAAGVNSSALKLFQTCGVPAKLPRTTKAYVCEFFLGQDLITRYLGDSMHVFLMNLPRLEFAALIPKSDYVTVCLLGHDLDPPLIERFLRSPQVKKQMPPHWEVPEQFCHCSPRIAIGSAVRPFADRVVLIGDCAATRLYKDGIGAAYRTAKAAALTAVFHGVSARSFAQHYWPECRSINRDNAAGRMVFAATREIQKRSSLQMGIWRTASEEQVHRWHTRNVSTMLWNTFTGSAPYRDVLLRSLRPSFVARLIGNTVATVSSPHTSGFERRLAVVSGGLGRHYRDGEIIYHQGEIAQCMYVVQKGHVEETHRHGDHEFCLAVLGKGAFFGAAELFEDGVRISTVRAAGDATVLMVEKQMLLRRIHQEPSLAFMLLQGMSNQIRTLEHELIRAGSKLSDVISELRAETLHTLDETPRSLGAVAVNDSGTDL
jgi:CRP-like cAMP-binding protein/flavin-dependent dehydrogenase